MHLMVVVGKISLFGGAGVGKTVLIQESWTKAIRLYHSAQNKKLPG